jgi:site-specific recombinase XerD
MTDATKLGPWVRRFLLEHLVGERNLARNTQRSYRDTLALMVPFIAARVRKQIDQLTVERHHCRTSATLPARPGADAEVQRGNA